jgi:hypothetical protein
VPEGDTLCIAKDFDFFQCAITDTAFGKIDYAAK